MPRKFNLDTLVDGLLDFAADFIHGYAAQVQAQAQVAQPRVPRSTKGGKKTRRRTEHSSVDGAEAYRRWAASAKPETPPASVTHYDVLGVSRNAEQEAIAGAHKALARKYHPDLAGKSAKTEARIRAINAAWEVLGDADKRKTYDKTLGGTR